jgi:hypothetical protein
MFTVKPIRMTRSLLFVALLMLLSAADSDAQMFPPHAKPWTKKPRALVVTLLTRGYQRESLRKYRPHLLEEFETDVREVNKRIVKDFSQNFRYCPVYFIIDTNMSLLAQGKWAGILFDSTYRPITKAVIHPGDKDFFIAHYGSPTPQPDSSRARTLGDLGGQMEVYGEDPTGLFQEKLIVTDADFVTLTSDKGPKTAYARALRPIWMSGPEYVDYRREMTYNARFWNIDYIPSAYPYYVTLRKYFRDDINKNRR